MIITSRHLSPLFRRRDFTIVTSLTLDKTSCNRDMNLIWISHDRRSLIAYSLKNICQKDTFKIFFWLLRYLGISCRFPLPKNMKISYKLAYFLYHMYFYIICFVKYFEANKLEFPEKYSKYHDNPQVNVITYTAISYGPY